MNSSKILNAAIEGFKQKFHSICQNQDMSVDKIDSESFAHMTRSLMEAGQAAGKAGLIEFLEQHDTLQSSVESNGACFRYKGKSRNELLTLFGEIDITRNIYYNEKDGGSYFIPLDHAIGLEKNDYATLDTREMVLFASASCVPRELSMLLSKCSLCNPSATAIQNIINKDGEAMEALAKKISANVINEIRLPNNPHAIVASLDGANVLLREPGEKKGRKNKRPVENVSPASSTSYHNAMVGAISLYGVDSDNKPERLSSIYTARMPEEKSTVFKDTLEQMILNVERKLNCDEKPIPKVLLTDGHLMIKGFAKNSPVLQTYEKLIDFFHTTEHLSKAAEAVYGENTDCSNWWFDKWRSALKTNPDAPGAIVRSLMGFGERYKLSAKSKKDLETEITFFKNNKHLMKYHDFIKRNLPIGSGPIEAAAKTIIKQRMCRSGMRWSREKGQYVLAIKAYVQSGLWESAWNQYKILKKAA